MKNFALLVCFLFLGTAPLMAQYEWTEGEIFFKNGDTKKGEVKLPVGFNGIKIGGGNIKYRQNEEASKEKFKEDEVEKVLLINEKGELAEFRMMPKNKRKEAFYHVIVDGDTKLYARKVVAPGPGFAPGGAAAGNMPVATIYFPGWDYNEVMVLRKGDKKPKNLILPNVLKSFKKQAMKYFSDCPSLVKKIDNKELGKDDMKEIVKLYNNCK